MEELYKFMNQSNATLDLKVGNELATEAPAEGDAAEVCDLLLPFYDVSNSQFTSVPKGVRRHMHILLDGRLLLCTH